MQSLARLEALIQEAVDARDVLGLCLAVVEADEVVYARGFGTASVEDGRRVTPGTLFDVGSIGKTALATLVMRLVDEGTLDLDAPVAEYLPGFAFSDPDFGRRVTLRHLLSHTSGLPSAGKDWGPPNAGALARFCREQQARHGFVAEPGRVHLYSNTAVTLAGYVAEVVTGRAYRELVEDLVCAPLGMTRTTFEHAVAMTYPLALPHREGPDGALEVVHRMTDNRAGEPSGFLYSTALDLARLAVVHLNGGRSRGEQFLSPESTAEMQRTIVEIPKLGATNPFAQMNSGYALGLITGTYRGERVLRHGGISQSFNCFLEMMPDRRRGFVALTNWSRDGSRLVDLVLRLYDRLLMDASGEGIALVASAPPLAGDAHGRWPQHVGTYLSVGSGDLIVVRLLDCGLAVERDGRAYPLVFVSDNQTHFEDVEGERVLVTFLPEGRADEGRPTEYLYLGGTPYRRVALDRDFAPDPSAWRGYVGLYRDPTNLDPQSTLTVLLRGDTLWLEGEDEAEPCRPIAPAAFLSSWGLLEFVDEPAGSVSLVVGKATRYERLSDRSFDQPTGQQPSL